ncbi:MAG: cytochrome c oxidase assembly protein [Burkholderiales bacterium]|nr:cytochrome c oxidase assembly protein [Anaerolineae bacterium]
MRVIVTFTLVMLTVQPLLAHEGGAIPADVWTHWNLNPLLLIVVMLPLTLYVRGAVTYPVQQWRNAAFTAGIATLFVALISPLDAISGSLFSAHMVQHLLLVLVAAPLFTLCRPLPSLLRGLPAQGRKAFGNVAYDSLVRVLWWRLTRPLNALLLHIAALLVWHLPGLYGLALDQPVIHVLEHASFFLTAALFWWTIRSADDYGVRVLCVFAVMMVSGLLGALMTFANTAWYQDHEPYVAFWGLTLLEDQQLAGLFMWIPTGFIYIVTAALLLGLWLGAVERRVTEREHRLAKEMSDE